jgi:AAA15 family ATPase/GTPase
MLVQFKVKNFLSIKEEQVFSMVAAAIKEKRLDGEKNILKIDDELSLLKSAVIYGANASGKSNLIGAFNFFKSQVYFLGLGFTNESGEIDITPFRFDAKTFNQPSSFEAIFIHEGIQYRYGFELTRKQIVEEWLYVKDKRETEIFHRTGQKFEIAEKHVILKDVKDKEMIRPNSLLISIAGQLNDPTASKVIQWLNQIVIFSGINDIQYRDFTINMLQNSEKRKEIVRLIKLADFGIDDIETVEREMFVNIQPGNDLSKPIQRRMRKDIKTKRNIVDQSGNIQEFESHYMSGESEGTKKFFHLTGPLLMALETGSILIVDELDTKLHPLLTEKIVALFNSDVTNRKNAQLIFATHDTNLLDAKIFRRDQIWFTEKDRYGATKIYPLTDIKARNDEALERNYIAGKYGAIPFLGDFDALIEDLNK